MTQWVLKINGQVVSWRSLHRLQPDELISDFEIEKLSPFDSQIKMSHGGSFKVTTKEHKLNTQYPWEEEYRTIPISEADAKDEKGTPLFPNSIADRLINAKVVLPHGESDNIAKVIRCSIDVNGQVIGNHNEYPILNTCIYECLIPIWNHKTICSKCDCSRYSEPS